MDQGLFCLPRAIPHLSLGRQYQPLHVERHRLPPDYPHQRPLQPGHLQLRRCGVLQKILHRPTKMVQRHGGGLHCPAHLVCR